MTDLVRSGGCACGAIRFHARGEPKRVAICHCMTCRKTHGAPFVAFVIFDEPNVTVEGSPAEWCATPTYHRCFCATCGSRVFGIEAGEIELSLGAFDDVGVFTPQYEAWAVRREPWLPSFGVPQHPHGR
ncbi:MAG TPA: GFA family protein [Kofleriaceae bacterium]|nr:GFA family protein [Kofleriaceae bacterium]